MKKIFFLALLLLAFSVQAQQRDRRSALKMNGYPTLSVSETGRLWLGTAGGDLFTAKDIHSTWRRAKIPENELTGSHLEHIAAFGDNTAVLGGFIFSRDDSKHHYDFVLRTSSIGLMWDTITVDPSLMWVHTFCTHADGRMWLGSASGRSSGVLAYSEDRGQSFTVLRKEFDTIGGIETIHMVTANSGFAGTYFNRLVSTSDNWHTFHRMTTPMDQGLVANYTYKDTWINRVRQWGDWLVVTEAQETFITPLHGEIKWTPLDAVSYEVDTTTGKLWTRNDSGEVVIYTTVEDYKTVGKISGDIRAAMNGYAYLQSSNAILCVSEDGKVDSCEFFTTETPIEEPRYTLAHGSKLWGTDGSSVYILDAQGWYRIASSLGVQHFQAHPDHDDRIIILRNDGKNYTIDTAGFMESYTHPHPLTPFAKKGIQSVEINTYAKGSGGYYRPQTIRYRRLGDQLREDYNTVDSNIHDISVIPASTIEEALMRFGDRYSLFPTPADFGLEDSTVDLQRVLSRGGFWSSSRVGFYLSFVNSDGDTLHIFGSTSRGGEINGSLRYPWLLPMSVQCHDVSFISYQPALWKALRPMMPEGMFLREYLDNSTLQPPIELQSGDLLFSQRSNSDKEKAIRESTGNYTHVGIVEIDSNGHIWIIESSQSKGVRRIAFSDHGHPFRIDFDIYRLTIPFDTAAVIERAKSFIGKEYDKDYLPNNDKLYCSELVYECYLDSEGHHLFELKPMNWRDKEGNLPEYWKKHFKELGLPIPEAVPGTNPTDISRSPRLQKL